MIKDYFNVNALRIERMKAAASALNNFDGASASLIKKITIIRNRIFEAVLEGKNNAAEQLYFDDGKEAYLQERNELEELFSAAGYTCGLLSSYEYLDGKFTGFFFIGWGEE
jgi:hypothetical protein